MVDDDHDLRESLRDLLEGEGYTVTLAENGRAAMHHLTTDHVRAPDLILVELRMPEMTGWELVALLRVYRKLSAVPVVVMSSLVQHGDVIEGVTAYVQKPINLDVMLETIRGALAKTV